MKMSLSLSYLFKPHVLSLNDGTIITGFNDGTIVPDRYQLAIWNGRQNPFHSSNRCQMSLSIVLLMVFLGIFLWTVMQVDVPQKALKLTRTGIGPFGDLKVAGKRYPPALQSGNKYTLAAVPDDPSDRSSTAVPDTGGGCRQFGHLGSRLRNCADRGDGKCHVRRCDFKQRRRQRQHTDRHRDSI